ncbi:MAG: PIN domain-containing protein [Gammaproteobacteria bacterium]|jgi:predicted nucleic-acid-binding protein|nr:PIN domain-containing protein [Gammaproteobacteria bacterium]
MIGLDTNVLVRYITQDDPVQSPVATTLIEEQCRRDAPGRVAQIVLCELVWVLRRAYGYPKAQVVEVLDQILVTAELVVENDELAFQALDAYRTGNADFSDYLLILNNRRSGCETTYSFDTRLCTHPNARLPNAPP